MNKSNNEQALITRCKKGEAKAMRELYEFYAPGIMSLCVRYVKEREAARDVMQEGFVKLFSRLEQYNGAGSFKGWVYQIFVNESLMHLRSRHYYDENRRIEDLSVDEAVDGAFRFEKLTVDDLVECIAELPHKLRTVFNLFAIEGFTHAEIAGMLGIEEGNSRVQYLRAKKILQEKISILTSKR